VGVPPSVTKVEGRPWRSRSGESSRPCAALLPLLPAAATEKHKVSTTNPFTVMWSRPSSRGLGSSLVSSSSKCCRAAPPRDPLSNVNEPSSHDGRLQVLLPSSPCAHHCLAVSLSRDGALGYQVFPSYVESLGWGFLMEISCC
jgi:hypothetical protein